MAESAPDTELVAGPRPVRVAPSPPAAGPPAFAVGEVVAGRFEIRRFLGQGGMGQVFEAFDRELGDAVALKALRPEIAGDERALRAFKREVSLARRVTHASACRIFELLHHPPGDGEAWGRPRPATLFLTMELLRGETLCERLRRGPMALGEVLAFARQLASALDAAHAAGVVHRDLKTGNVMLQDGSRLVVTDFGLALPASEPGPGSAADGTPAYMAPEQLRGEPATPASDVYAFGIILYEMVTGSRPSRAGEPAPAGLSRPDWPPEGDAVIRRCLEPSPERRAGRAGEALEPLLPMAGTSTGAGEERAGRRPAAGWGAVAVLALLAVLLAVASVSRRPAAGVTASDRAIVLGELENRTGDEGLGDALEHALRVALEPSPYLRVLSPETLAQALRRMERDPATPIDRRVGLELGLREDAAGVVVSSLDQVGSRYLLSVTLLDPRAAEPLATLSEGAAGRDHLLLAIERLARQVRRELGESSASIARASEPLEKVTTADLEALRLYSLGSRRLDQRLLEEAVPLLERSLELDPELAMAHAKLAAASRYLGRPHRETARHLDRALALRHRLTRFEELYLRAWSSSLQASPEAVASWVALVDRFPERGLAHYNLGMAHALFDQRWDLAAVSLAEAARHPVGALDALIHDRLGASRLALGKLDDAVASFEAGRAVDTHPLAGLVAGLIAAERHAEAVELLAPSLAHPSPRYRSEALLVLAAVHADQGRLEQALAAAEKARHLASAETFGPAVAGAADLVHLALLARTANPETVRRAAVRATAAAHELLASGDVPLGSLPVPRLALLGQILVRLGQPEPAQDLLAALEPLAAASAFASHKAYVAILQAELALAAGRPAEAVARLEQSLALAETFQAHAALARAAAAAGDPEAATRHRRWIKTHRGLALAERVVDESLATLNLLGWRDVER